jgi:hypothetical protein
VLHRPCVAFTLDYGYSHFKCFRHKGKVAFASVSKDQHITTYMGVEENFHAFYTPALVGSECSDSF